MPYTFNPFTGKFDYYLSPSVQSIPLTSLIRIGTFYTTSFGAASFTGGTGISTGNLYVTPFVISTPMTFSSIGVRVMFAGSANTVIRLGMYNNNSVNNTPMGTSLIADYGTVAGDSTGNKTIAINQALAGGIYWLALATNGGPSIQGLNNTMSLGTPDFLNLYTWYRNNTFTYGVLPATFPSTLVNMTTPAIGIFLLRSV